MFSWQRFLHETQRVVKIEIIFSYILLCYSNTRAIFMSWAYRHTCAEKQGSWNLFFCISSIVKTFVGFQLFENCTFCGLHMLDIEWSEWVLERRNTSAVMRWSAGGTVEPLHIFMTRNSNNLLLSFICSARR